MSLHLGRALLELLYQSEQGWTPAAAAEAFWGRDADETHRQAIHKTFMALARKTWRSAVAAGTSLPKSSKTGSLKET
jgi:hypothetical protein